MFITHIAYGQSEVGAQQEIVPQISEQQIKTAMETIANDTGLSTDEQNQIQDIYRAALGRLADGNADRLKTATYNSRRENAAQILAEENTKFEELSRALNDPNIDLFKEFEDQNLELVELEQKLAEENAQLVSLRNILAQKQSEKTNADQFPAEALALRSDNTFKIAELTEQTSLQASTRVTPVDKAAFALAQASLYARLQSNKALESRDIYNPQERELLSVEISHLVAQISKKTDITNTLQIMTGSARTVVAEQTRDKSLLELEKVSDMHPLLRNYAQENVDMSLRLLDIAHTEEDLPAAETKILQQTAQVILDKKIADQIVGTKKTSRHYGVHLRQLRQKQPSITRIRSKLKTRDIELQDVLFQKIINQEALDTFNASPLNVDSELMKFGVRYVQDSTLGDADIVQLRALNENRRKILNALASYSELRRRNLEGVNALQTKLLADVSELCALLDSRLLWLPSTEPVGFDWPIKIAGGIGNTIRGMDVGQIAGGFWTGLKKNFFFVFIALIILGFCYGFIERFKKLISGMSSRVGRVQKDSFTLTPIAILDGVVKIVPWVLLPLLIGLIYSSSAIDPTLSLPIMRTCFVLAGLVFVFMTLREWCRKGALFDLHFRVDLELRSRLMKHLPWLLVTQAISVVLIGLTRYTPDHDSGASALGVLGFLIGSISIAVFAIKIAWGRSKSVVNRRRDTEGIYLRNEKWFFLAAIVVPSVTAILAVIGYYETARLLLSRFFLSFCILMAAYVLHGLFRRTVLIAQRRLALDQARTRRDQAVKIRMEKVAAEERGEIPVPTLDYDRIDLETINRQSSQLVNVAVFLATIGVLWALWSNLLPALSVFNDVEIWGYDKLDTAGHVILDKETGQPLHIAISYWNLMQAFGIGFITWLAARNLPGFLEIFVLKRTSMEQSSRFAIVTVLGYLIFIIGILIAFDKLGTQWSQLQWIVAALSVGIGLGLQAIFANFVSGLIILFERPVRIGDYITVGDISGTVTRIQIRATTLMDLDNKEILIPNQELVSQQVTNWTLSNSVTRLIVNVGVAYGADTQLAHDTMLEVVKNNRNVLSHPEPRVLFLGFGDSSLDFEVRVFLRDFVQRYIVSHELHMALDAALRMENIEIAFPQRDLHIKTSDVFIPIPKTNLPKKRPKKSKA